MRSDAVIRSCLSLSCSVSQGGMLDFSPSGKWQGTNHLICCSRCIIGWLVLVYIHSSLWRCRNGVRWWRTSFRRHKLLMCSVRKMLSWLRFSAIVYFTQKIRWAHFNTSFITMAIVGLSKQQLASLFCVITHSSKFTKYLTNSWKKILESARQFV